MKRLIFLLTFILFGTLFSTAQITAIFVNDNSVSEENTEIIFQIIEQYLGTLAYFDAVQNDRSPNYSELEPYNLVVWYCGIDEDDLYFWNDSFEDNPYLIEYLDNGGSLWMMGRGFLNARYIKPPRNYSDGTFLNDYLGINKWAVESFTSDNGLGVPSLIISPDNNINTLSLNILEWKNPPEPMVDGCKLVDGCSMAYIFAPGGYELYGESCAFYFPDKGFKNITFTFDPASLDSKGNASTLLSDVLSFYEDVLSSVDDIETIENSLKIFPNPSSGILNIEFEYSGETTIKLTDIVGNAVRERIMSGTQPGKVNARFQVGDLPSGIYFVRIENSTHSFSKKVMITESRFP